MRKKLIFGMQFISVISLFLFAYTVVLLIFEELIKLI